MGSLYLVRHGQASFGADDYDQLSELGYRQCVALGEYWRARGKRFDLVLRGTLQRHRQSLAGIVEGLGGASEAPEALEWPGLNEYDSEAVIRAIHPEPLARPTDAAMVREHFRLLRQGLQAWMRGDAHPAGMPSYAEFAAGVAGALRHVLEHGWKEDGQGQVLIVSSGGPISTAVGQILATPAETTVELNLRIRNSSVTEFVFTPKRHMLVTYNTLPHLDFAEGAAMVTYA